MLAWIEDAQIPRRRERWSPLVLAAIVGLVFLAPTTLGKPVDGFLDKGLPLMIGVAAILCSLQTTAQSLMLALIDAPITQRLRRTGHYERLIDYFGSSGRSLTRFIGFALVAVLARDFDIARAWIDAIAPVALGFLFAHAWFCVLRLNRLMIKLLLHKDEGVAGPHR